MSTEPHDWVQDPKNPHRADADDPVWSCLRCGGKSYGWRSDSESDANPPLARGLAWDVNDQGLPVGRGVLCETRILRAVMES